MTAIYIISAILVILYLVDLFLSYEPTLAKCGIENCHGLDITCGPNISKVCIEEYLFGDRCRQFVSRETVDDNCGLVKSEEFEECKSCVEKCAEDFKDDIAEKFNCEGGCAK